MKFNTLQWCHLGMQNKVVKHDAQLQPTITSKHFTVIQLSANIDNKNLEVPKQTSTNILRQQVCNHT